MTRLIDLEQLHFSSWVRPGDTVAWGQCAAEPVSLTSRLMAQRHAIGGRFTAFIGATWTETFGPHHADVVDFRSYCGAANNRRLADAGVLDILPAHYSSFEELFAKGPSRVDVLLLQVAPADDKGNYSLSASHEYLVPLLDTARVVIAEVNDQAPWTYGPRTIRAEDFDLMVKTSRALAHPPASNVGEVERNIAARVAALVDDGATLQCGIGALPETVLAALENHRHLGVHSGAIGDAVARLMQQGAVTNMRKGIDAGCTVAGTIMGSDLIHRFAHCNPQVQFRSTSYTHDIRVLESLNHFVAINGAIEIDLTGQINAETAGSRYLGAVGGAMDFIRGARRSRGGLPVIVLPSRAGTRSRIVPLIEGPVSTPRSDAAIIVTEYGVADLRALPLSKRVDSLIAVAHPDDRNELERAASVVGRTTGKKEIS